MNRLEKTENRIDGLNSKINTLWGLLIVLFVVSCFGYIRLQSRINSLEGTPRSSAPPIKFSII